MKNKLQLGMSVIEVVLAAAIFAIFASSAVRSLLQNYNANRTGAEFTVATQFASEGIEAVKSIKNKGFSNLNAVNANTRGLTNAGSQWGFDTDGTNDTLVHNTADNYIRTIKVDPVNRDGAPPAGNIADTGTNDPDTKKITSTVTWNFSAGRPETLSLITYLSDWIKPITTAAKGGMLFYGNGGTTTDAVSYRILDGATGIWGAITALPDFDVSATNKALRVVRMHASAIKNEKIVIARYYNGTGQFIYGHVWDGSTWTSTQLVTWSSTTNLDAKNFSGAYLSNGNFLVVYSNNTTTPQYRIWNTSTSTWGAQTATVNVGGTPFQIVAKARPGTNEAMMAVFDVGSDTNTVYFNGTTWSATTEHAANAPLATKEFVDFAWSPQDTLRGALIFTNSTSDKAIDMRIWTANGTGGGAWGVVANSTAQTNNLGALQVVGRKGANEFMACNKDALATPTIRCYKATFTSATPSVITWSNPANQAIAAATDNGLQRSFDLEYEATSGDPAVITYSDNTNVPKFKKYNAVTSTFDAAATNIVTTPFTLTSPLRSVIMETEDSSNDIMALMVDSQATPDLYSVVWDGTNNAMFTTPAGKAFSQHGTNGGPSTAFWYDFAWDKF